MTTSPQLFGNDYWPDLAEQLLDEHPDFDEQQLKASLIKNWGQGLTYRRVMPMLQALRDAGVKQSEVVEMLPVTKQAVTAWYKGIDERVIKIKPQFEEALIQAFAQRVGHRYQRPSLQQQHAVGVRWAMWRVATDVMKFKVDGPPDGPTLSALVHVWGSDAWYRAYEQDNAEAKQAVINSLWDDMNLRWGVRLHQQYHVTDAASCYAWLGDILIDWTEPYWLTATFLPRGLWPADEGNDTGDPHDG